MYAEMYMSDVINSIKKGLCAGYDLEKIEEELKNKGIPFKDLMKLLKNHSESFSDIVFKRLQA